MTPRRSRLPMWCFNGVNRWNRPEADIPTNADDCMTGVMGHQSSFKATRMPMRSLTAIHGVRNRLRLGIFGSATSSMRHSLPVRTSTNDTLVGVAPSTNRTDTEARLSVCCVRT